MPRNVTPESTVAEADRRIEHAKASLMSRVEVLKHKLGDARNRVDVRARIAQHPLPAIAVAFTLGALAGIRGARRAAPERLVKPADHTLTSAARWALAAVSLRVMRELALGQLGEIAKQWWAERHVEEGASEPRPERFTRP